MAQDRETITESNSNINSISELPTRKFSVTMELPMFLIMLGMSLSGTAISNILFYRTCVHSLHHDKYECQVFLLPDKNNETKKLEDEVQKYMTFVSTVRTMIESIVPAILSFFLGVWSDTHGRKPLIVWPLFGMTMSGILIVIYSMMDNLGPWWYILTVVPYSLTGGFTVLFTGAFCYLSDITSTESRSFRMTVLEAAVSAGSVVGSVLSSYMLREIGNVYLLLVSATVNVVAYAFTNIHVTESLTGALRGGLTTVLDFLLVKEMMRECFKVRPNRGRAQILLLTVANSLQILILYGTMALDYMYTRKKLSWAMKDYTIFSASSTTIAFVGSFLGVTLIQKYLRVSDIAFSIIALISAGAEYLIRTFAVTTWHLYFGASISLFKGLAAPLIRSFLTKLLPMEDIAKVFSLTCALEGICPLIAPVMFNSLYAFTESSFPGAIFLLSAAITGVSVVMLGFVQYFILKSSISYQRVEEERS